MAHQHAHGPETHRGRLAAVFGITVGVVLAQLIGATLTGSLALLVDATHSLTDAAGLGVALLAAHLALRPPSARRTWGFRRAEVLAAFAQAAFLLAIGVYVLVEAVQRLREPPEVPSAELVVFGVIGLAGNLLALAVLASRRSSSFNLRAAFLEVLTDALGSIGVIVAAVVIAVTGWQRADIVAALLIGALIVPRAARLLGQTAAVLLESAPPGLDVDEVRRHLRGVQHVREVHDVHASLIATGLPVLSAHVVVEGGCFSDGHAPTILEELEDCVAEHFGIAHTTFQLEPAGRSEHSGPVHD